MFAEGKLFSVRPGEMISTSDTIFLRLALKHVHESHSEKLFYEHVRGLASCIWIESSIFVWIVMFLNAPCFGRTVILANPQLLKLCGENQTRVRSRIKSKHQFQAGSKIVSNMFSKIS